jgi:hypothetical protein
MSDRCREKSYGRCWENERPIYGNAWHIRAHETQDQKREAVKWAAFRFILFLSTFVVSHAQFTREPLRCRGPDSPRKKKTPDCSGAFRRRETVPGIRL